jgi:hypothetical protein
MAQLLSLLEYFYRHLAALWTLAGLFFFLDAGEGICAGDFGGFIQQSIDPGLNDAVEDIPAFAAVLDKPGFAKNGKLLGDVCLAEAEHGFDMANALLVIPQDRQDGNTGGMHEGFK